MMSSIKDNVTPMSNDFRQHCHNWLVEKFPSVASQGLIDGKSIEKWLDYICVEVKNRWQLASRSWNYLLTKPQFKKFFGAQIKITEQTTSAMETLEADCDDMEVVVPIDLSDLSIFEAFNCPNCDFKSKDRILFKTHVIENHEHVKGELTVWNF